MKKSVNKFPAFTLAEVLIALTIIGFISVITLPALFNDTQEQVTVAQLSKFYKNLSDAFKTTKVKYGPLTKWNIRNASDQECVKKVYEYVFKDNFKIGKDCGFSNEKKCIYDGGYKKLNGTSYGNLATSNSFYKLNLVDGATVIITPYSHQYDNILILYDVNGLKKPNQWGYDLFGFRIINNKVIPEGMGTFHTNSFDLSCTKSDHETSRYGYGCAAWVVYKGNMDYLDCDDLKWNGKQKCDNEDE